MRAQVVPEVDRGTTAVGDDGAHFQADRGRLDSRCPFSAHAKATHAELFEEYCAAVDAIVMLRAFRADRTTMPHRYQLLEVPTAIFKSLSDAPQSAFEADGPTIDCAYGGNAVAARVSLDRSDAKITVKHIQLSVCDIHAQWELQP